MNESLDERLVATLKRFVTDPQEWQQVEQGAPLLQATGLDSLSLLNLVTELELLFEVRFDPDSLNQVLRDVRSLDQFLRTAGGVPAGAGK